MELEVAASESSVMQKDDDSYPSNTIAEQAGNQHALLKNPKSMDKKEEDISGDASEEVYISPETTSEKIKACLPETGIKLTAPSISSVGDTQNTHDDIRHDIPSAEKETAEYGSDEMENENFAKQMLPPITEKSIEQPFYEESHEAGDNSAQLKAEDDSSMKTAEIIQVQNTHIPLTADQEDKSPQDLSYEKESDNEGMSPEDAQQISEEISESRNVSCADVDVESTSEPQQSYQEVLEPSQIIFEGANDSKENANDNSNDKEVTASTEEMLVNSSSAIEDSSKKIESEIYESKTIRSEDGAYVDQLAEHATIEAAEKSSQVGLAAVTGPANIQENDEHQTCQTVEENETISEMIKQNQIFQESDLQEKNVISTESISYDHANMTNAALEGDNDERVELKAEEIGYSFEEENVETATREPYSSDQISSTDEISVPFSEKGDSAISNDSDKISNLNDNGNMESIDTEAKLDMMQEVENKREIVVETASDDITEEINDESYMVSENQVDNLTNKATEEPDLIANSRQNIPLSAEDQINKLTDVREKAYESVGENNAIEEENDSIRSPDKDAEKISESNYEEIQNDIKPGQSCRNEPDIVKDLEIVNPEIEETKLDQEEQNQENSIHNDAIGPDGDAQSTFTNIEPTSIENHENLEDATNSAAAENNVTSEASINKGDDQNENQSLNVTCVQTGTEAEDTINKTDDSEKDVDLQYTEETQSTRDATVESFQSAITDEMEDDKNLEDINADPSREHDEINNKNSNYNEESNEYKEQEPNEANEFHSKDESKTEEAKTQVYEEGSSSNKEGIRTVEVSQSQDECSEVEDKQHEEQEDRSPYGEHDGVLADQVKAMNAGVDSQNENELNTSNSAGVHVQEDQTERESCKYDEMDESDVRKDKDIISQEFEQDNLVNAITSQESSPPIEPLEYNLGAAMDDPTVSQPSEIVDDETISVEARQAVGLEAEQHIKTNEDPEQKNDISADTIIQGDSADELQHMTNSAIGYENSTTFAEADKHGSGDHLKIVDCKDDEHAENLQESESENQGLATKEAGTAIEPNKDDNFDQLRKDLEHNNDAQSFENEGAHSAQTDSEHVLLEAGSDVEVSITKLSPLNTGTESDNIEVQNDGRDGEEGVCNDTAKTVPVTDPKIEDDLSTGIPSQSGKLDQEIYDNPVTSRDEGTGESSEAMQVVDIHEEVSTDCRVSPKEESSAASMDCKQDQEDQRGHEFFKNSKTDESHPEKDIELINQGFEQDSISSEMPCQKTSAAIEALRQDIGTAMDDHTQNEPSEIANDSKKANFETEQHNQTNEEPEHENEISAEEDMSIENRELVPESAEQAEENDTENETINRRAEDLGSNTVEDNGNENTNLEISQKEINTEDVRLDMDVVNRELIPESTKQREENNAEEAINSRTADLSSNTVEDLSGGENINLDEDPKVNTEVTPQDVSFENRELIPESVESVELTDENNTENEAVNSIAKALGSNTVEDLSGNKNTNSEISQKEINLDEDPIVDTEVVLQDMSVENRALVPESAELTEENNTENEAINSRAEDLGSNTVEDIGNENTNLEVSQKEISLNENPTVDTDVGLQGMDVESYELIPESTELREENSTENETVKCRTVGLGSKTVEDLSGNENTNSEISQKLTNLDEEKNAEVMPQVMDVENLEFIPESTENNTENEAINSKAEESGPNTAGDLGGNENTNSEISQKEINLDEDPIVKVNMLKTLEKIQDDEEPENTEREITQDGSDSQHPLAEERTIDQEKPIGTADTPRLENEETACMYDEEIQEVKETHEQCKFNEMNESVSFKNNEIESQGFEDDCASKRIQNEQTRMHSEASGQNVEAEIPSNQDNEESRIDASEVINRQEVAEHDEHRNEALLDKINEQEVTCPNASSSGNGIDTSAEQTIEPPLEISQTNNADQGLELGGYEQSIEGNEDEDELDSNKPKFNMEMVVNPIEETQCKDDRDNEINEQPTQTQSGNGISTAVEPSQYIQECETNDAKQDGNVSNVTKSYIDGHRIDEITLDETVQKHGKQPVEPQENFLEPSSPSEATSATQGKEDCSVTLQDLDKEKEEDPAPEKATQRELQVSSGFELCGDLPYKPAVEDVRKTEEYLVPEAQGANDPLDNEKMEPRSCTISYSHEINSDADQFQHNSQQTVGVSCADKPSIRPVLENYGHTSEEVPENQDETKSPEQLIESNNEEQTMEDIIDGSGRQAVKSEMTVEESKSEENYGPHGTSAYDSTEEKQVAAGSIEIVERSSEPVPFKESKKDEDEITEEKEETSADAESHEPEFYKIDNDADRDEKTLSSTECNTESDECSITISKDSKEISEEPHILVTSTSLEGEAVGENFQQSTLEERAENEVSMDASELLHQMNVPKPDNMDDEKEKQQESAKGLESQQGNDRILFTEMEVPEDLSSREKDSSHSEANLKVDEIQSEGKFPNESDVHMDCQEEEKISAAEIIASHICKEIESEEKLKQPSSEHQNQRPETSTLVTDANDTTFEKEVVCAPEEREIEHPSLEVEPDRDLEQKQDLNEELRTKDNSVRTDPNELSSEFQGVESSAEVENDTEDSTLERLNFKEVCHLNEKRETDESSQLNLKTQPISGENLVNSCEISEEIGNDTQLQTVKNELMGESSPSNFEVYEAVVTDAAGEQEIHDVNTTVSSEDRALEQPPLPTTKSCDETKKPLIADEHSANTTFSVSQVSGINNTPPTETNATKEKVSEEQPMKKVSNHDSDIPQTMQIDKEEQLQEITDEKYNETEEKPMLPSIIDEKKAGEWVIVSQNLQDDEKRAADEPKTEKEKEDTENDHGEEDSELIPMISEASRDIELKTQNKKSLHILSGMGSKMKNSISKVKKAMACASPQFSPDDVIIKLNKSKKS